MNTQFCLNTKSRGNLDKTKSLLINNAVALSLSMPFLATSAYALTGSNELKNQNILKSDLNTQNIKSLHGQTILTKKYALNIGETYHIVAQRFNVDVDFLQALNTHLNLSIPPKAGDIIFVPASPLKKNIPLIQKQSSLNNDGYQNQLVNIAAQIGSLLESNPNSDAASAMARNLASSTVNSSLEKWFSQYGRLRAQVNVDDKFSLKNSQYDLLLPIWENKKNLVFTQASVHRTDDRNQANLGFGIRRFNENYMIGGNTFIDYDMSNDHSRAGIGGEYWSNFLKISANGYLRLSNWKDSKKVEDYEERAANGWDIRTEGYLPAYPQLGGKLMYEKYYGNEVALFGKNNRQENPQALTLGVSYTPIPFITMNVEHKQGQDSNKDTSIGLQMNYQFGVPWAKQIDPKAVSALRSLAGNRYDFVERNNNIVLEYRKKELIFLNIAKQVRGFSGEQKSLEVSVQTKYGLDRIEWDAKEIIAQGGEVVQQGSDYVIKLPDYKYGRSAPANTYSISAIAYDTLGNASGRQTAQIEVTEAAVSETNSEFTPITTTLVANGKNSQALKLTVKDYKGHPIHIPMSEIELNVSSKTRGDISAEVSEWKKIADGEFEVTVTAGTQVETLQLTPTIRGVSLKPAKIEMIAGDVVYHSTMDTNPKEIIANDEDEAEISLTLEDEFNNTIKGKTVTFTATGLINTQISDVVEVNGIYKAKLKGTKTGTVTITAVVDGSEVNKTDVTLKPGPLDLTTSSIQALPNSIPADNKTKAQIAVELLDKFENPVEKGDVGFKISGVGGATLLNNADYEDGVYLAEVFGENAGSLTVTPSYNKTQLKLSTKVELVPTVHSIEITTNLEKTQIGGSGIVMTITPKDKDNTPLRSQFVTFNITSRDRQGSIRTDSGILQANNTAMTNGTQFQSNDRGVISLILHDPNGIGVEHIIQAKTDNGVTAEKSIYFTVLTSPDTEKAQMWGHMSAEKLKGQTSATFSRPKLATETSGYQDTYVENNETWALFNGNSEGMDAHCGGSDNIPNRNDYLSLFNVHGTSIHTKYGWPKNKLYRSSSTGYAGKYAFWLTTGNAEDTGNQNIGTNLDYKGYISCK